MNWVQNPIAIRVNIDANPLTVAFDMLAEDSDNEPPSGDNPGAVAIAT